LNGVLDRCCALVFVLKSMLLIWVVEIVLQHNPPNERTYPAVIGSSESWQLLP
jgi:hypothetical protein